MKITIYELLGLVKDGKAPKKIKTNTGIFKLEIEDDQLRYRCNDGGILTFDYYIENNRLSDEVEIIEEEPKKIEKITVREKTLGFPNGEWTARNMDKAFAIKINELINEVNKLKEGK